MTIVARLAFLLLCLSAGLGVGLRAQEGSQANPTATGECCPPPSVAIGSTLDAQVLLNGVFSVIVEMIGQQNAGRDLAPAYGNQLYIVNPGDRRYRMYATVTPSDFNIGSFTPLNGLYVFTWRGLQQACEEATSSQNDLAMTTPDTSNPPSWGDPGYDLCCCEYCCGMTQSGGGAGGQADDPSPTDAEFTPHSQLNPDGSNSALPGRPVVAGSNRSGAQLWWHYPITDNAPLSEIEVRHWDGTVATYTRLSTIRVNRLDSSGSPTREGDVWKLHKTTDPFDNITTYHYDQRSQLVRISYPNGIHAHWNWIPAWKDNWSGCSGIEIRHTTSSTPPTWGDQYADPHEDSTFLVFENLSSTQTHFAGKLIASFGERSSYVPAPAANQVFDVGGEVDGHKVTEFVYGTGGATSTQISEVRQYWHQRATPIAPRTVGTGDGRVTVLQNTYSLGQVIAQFQPHLGKFGILTQFHYSTSPTVTPPAGVSLATQHVVHPDLTESIIEFDPTNHRVYRERKLPGANGRPRNAEGLGALSGALVEPDEIVTDSTYDATCVCQKPIKVERFAVRGGTPEGRVTTRFAYDPITKWVTEVYTTNPATGSGLPAEVVETTSYTFDATAIWSPRWISQHQTPDGTTTFTYPNPMPRSSALNGSMQGKVVQTFTAVRRQTDFNTQATADIVQTVVRNIAGNLAMASLPYTGPLSGQPCLTVNGDGVEETLLYDTTHGRLNSVSGGGTTTNFVHDWWGRLQTIQTYVGSTISATWTITQGRQFQTLSETLSGGNVETRYHYDLWGNLAVVRRKNAAASGGSPVRHGASTTARAWIREEYHYTDTWLQETRVDRRPVDEGDSSPFSTSNPLFLVTRYEPQPAPSSSINLTQTLLTTMPNGAVVEEQMDGFGTPFKKLVRESDVGSAPVIEVSRIYNDVYLRPVVLVKGSLASAPAMRITRLTRNAAGAVVGLTEPSAPTPTMPANFSYTGSLGGAVHEFDIDTMGRTIARRLKNGSTLEGQWAYAYDQLGRTIRTETSLFGSSPSTHQAIVTYKAGKLSQIESNKATDAPLVTRTYDFDGRLSTVTDAAGNVTTYTYQGSTDLVASVSQFMNGTSPQTFVTTYTYDNQGRQTKTSVGASSPLETSYAYTSLSHVEQVTDPMNRVQKMLHDALGRRVDHVRLGASTDFIRNSTEFVDSGLANSKTYMRQLDGLGSETRTHFDFAGRKFAIHYPGADLTAMPTASVPKPNTELFVYDGLSQIQQRFDGDGGETAMVYDGAGRLIARWLTKYRTHIAAGYNAGDVLNRDVFGRIGIADSLGMTNSSPAQGDTLTFGIIVRSDSKFDSLSRVTEESLETYITSPQVLKTKSSYSSASRFRTGLRYEDGYNLQNLDLSFTPSTLQQLGTVSWQRPSVGPTTHQLASYSWLGSMRQQRTSIYGGTSTLATAVESYTYDQYGRMTQMKDVVTPTGGSAVEKSKFDYTYNAASNLLKEEYAKVGGKVGDRFTYDAYHRLKEAYMGVNSTVMGQDWESNPPPSFDDASMDQKLDYNLDAAQNRTSVVEQVDSSGSVTHNYDLETPASGFSANRYETAHGSSHLYDERGNLAFDGRFFYVYDFLNRLQEVWLVSVEESMQQSSMQQSSMQQSSMQGESMQSESLQGGSLEAEATPSPQQLMLEASARATAAGSGDTVLVLDGLEGLREARKQVQNEVNNLMRRLPIEHRDPAFRARLRATIPGGAIQVPAPAASSTGGGGMPSLFVTVELQELGAAFAYDAYNRRVAQIYTNVAVTASTYDGWREVGEYLLKPYSGLPYGVRFEPWKQFVHGESLDEMLAYRVTIDGTTWEDYHILHGGQDTAAKLVDQNGNVVETYEYDPYGMPKVFVGSSTTPQGYSSKHFDHLWKGLRWDAPIGKIYMRNRFYDPVTGRFMSCDPMGVHTDAGNMGNEYAYAWLRPLVAGDAYGDYTVIVIVRDPTYSGRDQNYDRQVATGKQIVANDPEGGVIITVVPKNRGYALDKDNPEVKTDPCKKSTEDGGEQAEQDGKKPSGNWLHVFINHGVEVPFSAKEKYAMDLSPMPQPDSAGTLAKVLRDALPKPAKQYSSGVIWGCRLGLGPMNDPEMLPKGSPYKAKAYENMAERVSGMEGSAGKPLVNDVKAFPTDVYYSDDGSWPEVPGEKGGFKPAVPQPYKPRPVTPK
ncbi:MAG: hypothetical protein JNL12_18895 [Planctomycetes bacterium]|nr:hypothetical protein [Planctomycetota bacterium]